MGTFHQELLSAFADGVGLILVTGPTGHGKTTAISEVLPACSANIIFVGDIRDVEHLQLTMLLAHTHAVLGVLRIPRAAGAFIRLLNMGITARDVAEVTRVVFTTRLFRRPSSCLLLHERLRVTAGIRSLIEDGTDQDAIHRQAIADGMRSLRETALDHFQVGKLGVEQVFDITMDD